jgi:DNA repair protein RadC
MAETGGDQGLTAAAELLRALLQVLAREREAILSLDEVLLAEAGACSQQLLAELTHSAARAGLSPVQSAGLSGLIEEARRLRDENMRLLKTALSELESDLSQLSRQKKNLRAYLLAGPAAEDPAEALFLYRKC